jgi:hypothetical protein
MPRRGIALLLRVGFSDSKFVQTHIDAIASELDAFHFQQRALMKTRFPGQQNPAPAAQNPMPRKLGRRRSSQRPCDLARCSGISRGAGHAAIGRDLPPRYFPHRFLNIFKITHCCLPFTNSNSITQLSDKRQRAFVLETTEFDAVRMDVMLNCRCNITKIHWLHTRAKTIRYS